MILVGHGSRHPARAAAELDRLAAAVAATGRYRWVRTATLLGRAPRPADVLADPPPATGGAAPAIRVVPVTMCDGATAQAAIPAAFAVPPGCPPPRLLFLPPVGTHPALARLIGERAHRAAGPAAPATALLLIGHGSPRIGASAAATRLQAARIAATGTFREVAVAFLEQPPTLAAVLARLAGPVLAIGLFATAGRHAVVDVGTALAAAGRRDVRYLGPIGGDPGLAHVILAILAATDEASAADVPAAAEAPSPPAATAVGPTEGRSMP